MVSRRIIDVDITGRADGQVPSWDSGSGTHVYIDPATGSGPSHATCEGRLTLTTATPITTTDVTAATTLYFTPFRGNRIGTYDGAAWSVNAFTEKSITLATLTSGLPYDVFIVDATLALELVAWSNATTRVTALALQDGIYCKTGALTRRYLGTICIKATGQCEDSLLNRFVWNYYNRALRAMKAVDTTDSWTYAVSAWQQANAATGNKVQFVVGVAEDIVRSMAVGELNTGSGIAGCAAGIGLDATNANSAEVFQEINGGAGTGSTVAIYRGYPGIGYHYLAWLEYRRAGTITFNGDGGVADMQNGITAEVWG